MARRRTCRRARCIGAYQDQKHLGIYIIERRVDRRNYSERMGARLATFRNALFSLGVALSAWPVSALICRRCTGRIEDSALCVRTDGDFAAQRSVELRAVPRQVEGQAVVEFTVLDTGKGLAPEVLERLYEAFFSTKPEGMGIGLNLCRSIVESHQGRMKAENLYNGPDIAGCRFSFWIPVTGTTNNMSSKDVGVTV